MPGRKLFRIAALATWISAVIGCNKLLDIEPGTLDPDADHGNGGAGPSSPIVTGGELAGSSSSSGTGGRSSVCVVATDCPAPLYPQCRTAACMDGACAYSDAPPGKVVISQIAGDCHQFECDGAGSLVTVVADDPPDDGKECTVDACAQGKSQNSPKILGTACQQNGGAVCSSSGECVQCVNDGGCPGQICKESGCVPSSCADGQKNGTETAPDCGGSCNLCSDGLACKEDSDCRSHVCANKVCKAPNCADGVANGAETDVDCGGYCPPCTTGKTCSVSADCQSEVCIGAICQAPKCTDGKKNGWETDVDCGKSCPRCSDGKACTEGSDCTGSVCVNGSCCTPQSPSILCGSKCGAALDNCGLGIDCGGCAPPNDCIQQKCVCVPEETSVTCKDRCGGVLNRCLETVYCGPCNPTSGSSSSGGGSGGSSGASSGGARVGHHTPTRG